MKIGIYIHIPFCIKKCRYCDFHSFAIAQYKERQEAYVEALCVELKAYALLLSDYEVATIYFGGGTPSILEVSLIAQIMSTIKAHFAIQKDAEVTLECNPETTNYDAFLAYAQAGINRLSMGLQSTNNEMLKRLGRVHTFETFKEQYDAARKAGFTNINVDLMSALPGQTSKDYETDVRTVMALDPEHISSYSLIIEEGTPFAQDTEILNMLPEEEDAVMFYHQTKEWLAEAGYERYEISNYAKPGYESRHNSSYWTGQPYLGVGLGASSYLHDVRFQNETDLDTYIQERQLLQLQVDTKELEKQLQFLRREEEILSQKDRIEEFMFLGLRMMKGICVEEFSKRFGQEIEEVYGEIIAKYERQKLLEKYEKMGKHYIALTEEGIQISNRIFVDFML